MTFENSKDLSENDAYKKKYRDLKVKLKSAVTKNEFLKSELRVNQKKLQIVEEDKYFLLERLLSYEKPPPSPEQGKVMDRKLTKSWYMSYPLSYP